MRQLKLLIIFTVIVFAQINTKSQFTVTGSNGKDGTYATLTNAGGVFAALNSSNQSGRNIIITVTDNSLTENGANSLTGAGGMWSSLKIYTTGNFSVATSTVGKPLIDFNTADNVTIDGRIGQAGSDISLTLAHNDNTNNSSRTIRFINDAKNDTIRYCKITGACPSSGAGIIFFSTASTPGTGNDNNVIDNCEITSSVSRPINAIISTGSGSKANSNNTISNNKIYNFLHASSPSSAITLGSENDAWFITGNSFYETTNFVQETPAGSMTNKIISISSFTGGVGNHLIANNYIGGSGPYCTGTWKKTNAYISTANINSFYIIHLSQAAGTTSSIQGNIIKGFNWDNADAPGFMAAIYVTGSGNCSIGTISGNTIGSPNDSNSIIFSSSNTSTTLYGIYAVTNGTVDIKNDTVCNITGINNNPSNYICVYGICDDCSNAGNHSVSGNVIYNLKSDCTGMFAQSIGIYFIGSRAASTTEINNNFVYDLGLSSGNTSSSSLVHGIYIDNHILAGAGTSVIRNIFNNIVSLGTGVNNDCTMWGLSESGSQPKTNNYYFNTVYIGGNTSGSGNSKALNINCSDAGSIRDIRNNIFINARSRTGGTGKHYSIYYSYNSGLTVDHNNYYVSGTGGVLGYNCGTEKNSLPIINSQDENSVHCDPMISISTSDANGKFWYDFKSQNYLLRSAGVTLEGYDVDFSGYPHLNPPSIGSIENDNVNPVVMSSFSGFSNKRDVVLKWVTEMEINNSGFEIQRMAVSLNTDWTVTAFIPGKGNINTPTEYNFTDKNLTAGLYKYRLKQIDYNTNYTYYYLSTDINIGIPEKFTLHENYPNPFNPVTNIDFEIPVDSKITLKVYDAIGREVAVLINEAYKKAGFHSCQFNANNLSSGIYFYRITDNENKFSSVKKMVIIK